MNPLLSILRRVAATTLCLALIAPAIAQESARESVEDDFDDRTGQWHLSVYSGKAATDRLLDIITKFNTPFIDSYLVSVAPAWTHRETRRWRFEVEGQVVKHWGDFQDHWEFNSAYIARWKPFWWDNYVDTSVAVGAGFSYATEVPPIEPRANRPTTETSAKLLGYLMLEFEFAPPNDAPISAFVRLHHRSGGKGIFKDVDGGSNFITGGLRWQF